jgi:DNA-damage-inducible protein D
MNEIQLIPSGDGSPFDAIRRTRADGTEYWLARELMPLLGYTRWAYFLGPMRSAWLEITMGQGRQAADLAFTGVAVKSTGGRNREDMELSRYAAYLTAMSCDVRKPEVRAARVYFVVQTRNAEIMQAKMAAAPVLPATYGDALEALLGQVRANEELEARTLELTPKAEAFEKWQESPDSYTLRQVAKEIGWKEGEFRQRMVDDRILYRMEDGRGKRQYDVYAGWCGKDLFEFKHEPIRCGADYVRTIYFTPKGMEWARQRYGKDAGL